MRRAHLSAMRILAPGARAIGLACLALCLATPLPSQGPEPGEMEAIANRVRRAEFTTLRGEILQRTVIPGLSEEGAATERTAVRIFDVTLERPNRCRIAVISPSESTDGLIVSDGDQMLCVSNALSQAKVGESPESLSEIPVSDLLLTGMGSSALLSATLGMTSSALLALDPQEIHGIQSLGSADVHGAVCDVFEITAESGGAVLSLTLAIDRGSDLLRRCEMTMGAATSEAVSRVTEEYLWLELDEPLDSALFDVTPPTDTPVVSAFDSTAGL
jgi:outer membrane lipoprotein-sorting protein